MFDSRTPEQSISQEQGRPHREEMIEHHIDILDLKETWLTNTPKLKLWPPLELATLLFEHYDVQFVKYTRNRIHELYVILMYVVYSSIRLHLASVCHTS